MRLLELSGTHYTMGRQHAAQVRDLLPMIDAAMHERLAALDRLEIDVEPHVNELAAVWADAARPTFDMLRGITDELELAWEPFFRYTVASYVQDRAASPASPADGCTVWAGAAPITRTEAPILVKNRDYRTDHQLLQCVACVQPEHGYRYACVTSAGSPAVFSSGMNEAGLAVADTHVVSRDIGPGVPRYAVEMELLEHHDTVASALDYLHEVPHLGDGTLTLIDRAGAMAVVETTHSAVGVVRDDGGFVVSTNHFVTPALYDAWIEERDEAHGSSSKPRHARITTALERDAGSVDATWARTIMTEHGATGGALCRHPHPDDDTATISTAIFLPDENRFLFANGQPCETPFETVAVTGRQACSDAVRPPH